jgi:hypothetical protein
MCSRLSIIVWGCGRKLSVVTNHEEAQLMAR